jgi:hypothetical protein
LGLLSVPQACPAASPAGGTATGCSGRDPRPAPSPGVHGFGVRRPRVRGPLESLPRSLRRSRCLRAGARSRRVPGRDGHGLLRGGGSLQAHRATAALVRRGRRCAGVLRGGLPSPVRARDGPKLRPALPLDRQRAVGRVGALAHLRTPHPPPSRRAGRDVPTDGFRPRAARRGQGRSGDRQGLPPQHPRGRHGRPRGGLLDDRRSGAPGHQRGRRPAQRDRRPHRSRPRPCLAVGRARNRTAGLARATTRPATAYDDPPVRVRASGSCSS